MADVSTSNIPDLTWMKEMSEAQWTTFLKRYREFLRATFEESAKGLKDLGLN